MAGSSIARRKGEALPLGSAGEACITIIVRVSRGRGYGDGSGATEGEGVVERGGGGGWRDARDDGARYSGEDGALKGVAGEGSLADSFHLPGVV